MIPLIPLASLGLSLAEKFLPPVAEKILSSKHGNPIAKKVAEVALDLVGKDPESATLENVDKALKKDSNLLLQFKTTAIEAAREVEVAQINLEKESVQQQAMSERVSLLSEDKFVRWSRPSHLWATTFATFALVIMGAYIIVMQPDAFSTYTAFIGAITPIIIASNAVGGLYVHQRSREKRTVLGNDDSQPRTGGILDTIRSRLR